MDRFRLCFVRVLCSASLDLFVCFTVSLTLNAFIPCVWSQVSLDVVCAALATGRHSAVALAWANAYLWLGTALSLVRLLLSVLCPAFRAVHALHPHLRHIVPSPLLKRLRRSSSLRA
jgi:hypothetical protein